MSMQHIRDKYGIPIKRGMRVRHSQYGDGAITKADHHISVRFDVHKGKKRKRVDWFYTFHPGDLDYLIDGEWKRGRDYIDALNQRIEAGNKALNQRTVTLPQ